MDEGVLEQVLVVDLDQANHVRVHLLFLVHRDGQVRLLHRHKQSVMNKLSFITLIITF